MLDNANELSNITPLHSFPIFSHITRLTDQSLPITLQLRLITTAIFRLAAPLLPASPLSIFDHLVSPTSLGTSPSPTSPNRQHKFLSNAKPCMAYKDTYEDLTPTLLWPRTPPRVPQRIRKNSRLASSEMKCEDQKVLEESCTAVDWCVEVDATEHIDVMVSQRSKRRSDFNCLLAADSAADSGAAMDQSSSPPLSDSLRTRSAKNSWKKLFLKSKSKRTGKTLVLKRRSRVMWRGRGDRA